MLITVPLTEYLWVPALQVNFQLSRQNFGNINAKLHVLYRNISAQLCPSKHFSINRHAKWNVSKGMWIHLGKAYRKHLERVGKLGR